MTDQYQNLTCPVGANLDPAYNNFGGSVFDASASLYPVCAADQSYKQNFWYVLPQFLKHLGIQLFTGLGNIISTIGSVFSSATNTQTHSATTGHDPQTHSATTGHDSHTQHLRSSQLIKYEALMDHLQVNRNTKPDNTVIDLDKDKDKDKDKDSAQLFSRSGLNGLLRAINTTSTIEPRQSDSTANDEKQDKKKKRNHILA